MTTVQKIKEIEDEMVGGQTKSVHKIIETFPQG